MDEKWHATLLALAREPRAIVDVGFFRCCQPGLCLYKSLPGCFEILVLVECDPDCVSSRWHVERSRNCSGVETNRCIDREPKSVRKLTPQVISLQPQC